MKITTVQIKSNRVLGSCVHENMEEAEEHVAALRISGKGSTFSFENESGQIVKVVKK